jgi:hypothetical protein
MRAVKVVRTRSNAGGAMRRVGWAATGLGALGLLAAVAMVVKSLPELRRYVKMETM